MDDTISRQAMFDTVAEYEKQLREIYGDENELVETVKILKHRLIALPSIHPEPSTEIQEILDYLDTTLHPIVSPDNWYVYAELHDMISTLQSAQPKIIRCKECENWDTTWQNDWGKNYHYCPLIDGTRNGNWYCADAERRTDDEE